MLDKYDFYLKNVKNLKNLTDNKIFENNEVAKSINILHDDEIISGVNNSIDYIKKNNVIYYISDLHLDHKIIKKFPRAVKVERIVEYIRSIVHDIVNCFESTLSFNTYLLIAGDVSHSFEISKIFYEELAAIQSVWSDHIIVILGNHELWEKENISITINKYKKLFEKLDITFLNNELLYLKGKGLGGTFYKIGEEEINRYSQEEIRNICLESKLTILGGIGFSGLNDKYNASCGLYREAVKYIEEDQKLSLQFEKIYLKIKKSLGDREVIILTHTPKNDWSKDNYNSNWIYVNGHTHRNEYYKDEEKIVYADNQIGYYNDNFRVKHFSISRKYDIFKYFNNGIYEISPKDYIDFVYGMGIKMEYNRKNGTINMLKKDGIYCFILNENNKLYLLDGGKIYKLVNSDINYYYENMSYYSKKVRESTERYNNYMKEVSKYVKSFGGYGTIHGCIIDIDFLNHLYINPYDGKVIPYFAYSIVDKYIYKDLSRLLSNRRPDLYLNYKMLNKKTNDIVIKNKDDIQIYNFKKYESTTMYKESRIMKALQYLINDNIIRIWNDNLINDKEKLENILLK